MQRSNCKRKFFLIFMFLISLSGFLSAQICGDVNSDNHVNTGDVLSTARYLAGMNPPEFNPIYADVNNSGGIDYVDVLLIAQYSAAIIPRLNCPAFPTPTPSPTPAATPVPTSENLLSNPGFENGTTSGWFGFGGSTVTAVSTVSHSGTYSLYSANRTSSWQGPAVNLVPIMTNGETYEISVWAMMDNSESASLNATLKMTDGSGTKYLQVATKTVTNTEWAQFKGIFVLNATGAVTELVLYIENAPANIYYYIDDASIIRIGEPASVSEIKLSNPGFESGSLSGWTGFGGCSLEVSTAQVHSGIYAAYASNRTQSWMGAGLNLLNLLENGKTYQISVWVRLDNAASASVAATMKKTDDNGDSYSQVGSSTVTNSGWTKISGYYKPASTGTVTEQILYLETTVDVAYYVDDASITIEQTAPADIIANPGFESGTQNWYSFGSCTFAASTAFAHSGTSSGLVTNRTASWQGPATTITNNIKNGQTYQVSVWVRMDNITEAAVNATFKITDDNGTSYKRIDSKTVTASAWTELSSLFTFNAAGTLKEVVFYLDGPAAGVSYYIDDAGIKLNTLPLISNASINPGIQFQVMEGFGASVAWYTNWITQHPNREALNTLLFSGLGLDILRVRNDYNHQAEFISDYPVLIADAQASLGRHLSILMSSWTPPAALKSNDNLNRGTLKKDASGKYMYAGFADYWYNSILAYKKIGVNIDFISIQNEPDFEADWETCMFTPYETAQTAGYGEALNWVYNRLRFMKSKPKIIGPEPMGIQFTPFKEYVDNLNINQVYGYCHHLYNGGNSGFPDTFIPDMQSVKNALGYKPLFMTEYSNPGKYLELAWLIHNALVEEGVSAYLFWDLLWEEGQNSTCLVSIENPWLPEKWKTTEGYIIPEYYYSFKQFSKFIDKGWIRVDASAEVKELKVSAFTSPDNSQMTVIIVNTGYGIGNLILDLNGFTSASSAVYQTTDTLQCADTGAYNSATGVKLPSRSVTTVVFSK